MGSNRFFQFIGSTSAIAFKKSSLSFMGADASSMMQSDLKTPVFLTRVSPKTLDGLLPGKGPGFNDLFSSKSFSFSKGLKIPVESEVFILFLLKALQNETIFSMTARIIPPRNKGAFLTGMRLANLRFK